MLELLPDCSNLLLVSCSGLLGSDRLAAIRNLPELDIDPEQISAALESGLTAESLLFNGNYESDFGDFDKYLSQQKYSFKNIKNELGGYGILKNKNSNLIGSHL